MTPSPVPPPPAPSPSRRASAPWRLVLRHLAPEGSRLAGIGAALVAATALPLAAPQLIARFVDRALAREPQGELMLIGAGYLAVVLAGHAFRVLASYWVSGAAWRTTNRLRETLAEHAVHLDMEFHGRHTPGEMVERVDGDLHRLTEFFTGFVAEALAGALLLAGSVLLTWLVDVRLGASLTLLVVVGGGALVAVQRRVVPFAAAVRQAQADMYGSIEERLVAVDEVRANGAGEHVLRRLGEDAGRVLAAELRWMRRSGAVFAGTNLLFAVGTALLVGEGVWLRAQGAITLGTIVLLFQYAQMARSPVEQIVSQAKLLHEAGAAVTRVGALLAEEPALRWTPAPSATVLPAAPLGLRLRDVWFAYGQGEPVLRGLDLEVPAGRALGLVGKTGSGKTTIARLALRLYDPSAGTVELGGADLRTVARPDLRARARMVTQDAHLFTASVRENVAMFDAGASDTAVARALEEVGLGAWLSGLPDGLDTFLGTGGVGVSAGEAQLLALSRCFLADPAFLVLDEPASRLDPVTEDRVAAAIRRLLAGRTAIVIAHRPATLRAVDRVVEVAGGRLADRGSAARSEMLS